MSTSEQPLYLGCLAAMGIDVWVRRVEDTAAEASSACTETTCAAQAPDVEEMDWETLRRAVSGCTRCELHRSRTQTVFGVGNEAADWMVVGEAPGAEEDRKGEPFVGRAGMLLNAMLAAIGLRRETVFIANILKCRPPRNRDPRLEEVASCEPYLKRQIALVGPKIILAVGRIAAQNLLKVDTPIGRLRGKVLQHPELGIPVVVTYHPAYLLRSPRDKHKAWSDLLLARRVLEASA